MNVRKFHPDDIIPLADIQIDCDATDPLAQYMVRDTDKYPDSYRRDTVHFLIIKLLEPGTICLVAEVDTNSQSGGRVAGWMIATRHGKTPKIGDQQQQISSIADFKTALHNIEDSLPPSTGKTANTAHCDAIHHIVSESHPPDVFNDYWELDGMYVAKDCRRRGIGTALTLALLEQARKEGMLVATKASPQGAKLYRKMAFQSYKKQEFEYFFQVEEPGYQCMFWDDGTRSLEDIRLNRS